MAVEMGGTAPLVPVEIIPEAPFPNDLDFLMRVAADKLMRSHAPPPEGYQRSFDMLRHADPTIWDTVMMPHRRIDQVVLKTKTRCNLACDYCFEYEGADQSWQDFPDLMPDEVIRLAAERFGVYASQEELPKLVFAFHGGEPLLSGVDFLTRSADELRSRVGELSPKTEVLISAQTNAYPLNERVLNAFLEHDIKLSASVDGDQVSHDRHRKTPQGHGTFARVKKSIDLLRQPEYQSIYEALLCVIDIKNNPIDVYEALKEFNPPLIEMTLPYVTWDSPPKGHTTGDKPAPYADWLITVFDKWWSEKLDRTTPPPPDIRLFTSIAKMVLGGWSTTEHIGRDTGGEVVIRPNATYENVDGMKWGADGLVVTGMNLREHDVKTVERYMRDAHLLGTKVLAKECEACPFNVRDICGGGHIANRYSKEREFDNASVYCHDLASLIGHVSEAVYREIQYRMAMFEDKQVIDTYFQRHRNYEPRVR